MARPARHSRSRTHIAVITAAVGCAVLAGCGKKPGGGPAAGGGGGGMVIPVLAMDAKLQPVAESLSLVGSIQANEAVEVKSEIDGVIQDISFQEGQQVGKGDLLIRLDETKLATTLAEAEATYRLSQTSFDRAKQLYKDHLISQQEYDQAAAAFNLNEATVERRKRELKDARIYAPFSGVVGARFVSPGQVIARSALLTVLVDLDPVKVEVNVPERFLGQVRVGQTLALSVAAFPARKFEGKVYFVAPDVDPGTRTALVKALVANPEFELKPGMFANLDLTLQVRDQAVVVSEAALVHDQDKTMVWVIGADDTVKARTVRVGLRLPGYVEITDGLRAGEKVVVEGTQKVMPGVKVKAAPADKAS